MDLFSWKIEFWWPSSVYNVFDLNVEYLIIIPPNKQRLTQCHVPRLKVLWCERSIQSKGIDVLRFANDAFAFSCSSCVWFFGGREARKDFGNGGKSPFETSRRNSSNERWLTNVFIAINIM